MLVFKLPTIILGIVFRHEVPVDEHDVLLYNRITTCTIYELVDGQDATQIAQAESYCSKKDNFEKERGRKTALTRALDKLTLDSDERRSIWELYLRRGL